MNDLLLVLFQFAVTIEYSLAPFDVNSLRQLVKKYITLTDWNQLLKETAVLSLAGAAGQIANAAVFFWMMYHVSSNEGNPMLFAGPALGLCVPTIGLAFALRREYSQIGKQLLVIGAACFVSGVGFGILALALPGFRDTPSGTDGFNMVLILNLGAISMAAFGAGVAASRAVIAGRNMVRIFGLPA